MVEIEGWKKVFQSKRRTRLVRWRSEDYQTRIEVYYTKYNETNGYAWFIDVISGDKIKSAQYDTRKEAIIRAEKYMRSHPNG